MLQHRMCVAVLEGHTETVWALAALPEGRLANGSEGDEGVEKKSEEFPASI